MRGHDGRDGVGGKDSARRGQEAKRCILAGETVQSDSEVLLKFVKELLNGSNARQSQCGTGVKMRVVQVVPTKDRQG